MKKLLPLMFAVLLVLTGCGNSSKEETVKFYDEDAVSNVAKALDSRWEQANKINDADITVDDYKKLTKIELDILNSEDFSDKKFENNKLKELYLSYKNKMEEISEMLENTTVSSLPDKWTELFNERTKIISNMNSIKQIPVKNTDELKGLINNGNEVEETEELDKKIDVILSKVKFSEIPQKDDYPSEYKDYEGQLENTTDKTFKDFNMKVYLEDDSGVRVDSQDIYISDWEPGQKIKVNFSTNKSFTNTKAVKDSFELDK